jgi:hypothetical protein
VFTANESVHEMTSIFRIRYYNVIKDFPDFTCLEDVDCYIASLVTCVKRQSRLLSEREYHYNTTVSAYFITTKEEKFTQHVHSGLLGCDAMCTSRWVPTIRRNILPAYSELKKEAECSTETLVSSFKSTLHYNPEDQHRHEDDCLLGCCTV